MSAITDRTIPLKQRAAMAGLTYERYIAGDEIATVLTDASGRKTFFEGPEEAEQFLARLWATHQNATAATWLHGVLHGWAAVPQVAEHKPLEAVSQLMRGNYYATGGGR